MTAPSRDDGLREALEALAPIAARMVRLSGGCEKGHKAGQWHMHDAAYHETGRQLVGVLMTLRAVLAALHATEGTR